jgi:hypothetical protein
MNENIEEYLIDRYNNSKNKMAKDKILMMMHQNRDTLALERIAEVLEKIYYQM